MLDGFPLLQHVEVSGSVNPANSSRRSGSSGGGSGGGGGRGGGSKKRRNFNGKSTGKSTATNSSAKATAIAAGTGAPDGSVDGVVARSRNSVVKTTSYMCAKTESEEIAFQNAVAGRESMNVGSGRPAPPVYVVADGEEHATSTWIDAVHFFVLRIRYIYIYI